MKNSEMATALQDRRNIAVRSKAARIQAERCLQQARQGFDAAKTYLGECTTALKDAVSLESKAAVALLKIETAARMKGILPCDPPTISVPPLTAHVSATPEQE